MINENLRIASEVYNCFQILFRGHDNEFEEKMSFPIGQDVLSASITHMKMNQGLKNITVQAIGKLLIDSETVPYNITISKSIPKKDRKNSYIFI